MRTCVYLINLDGSEKRLRQATRQLNNARLDFERVSAFDGRKLCVEDFPGYDAGGALQYMGRPLRGGEIGCYLSHVSCVKRFLATDAECCVVLEDDLELEPAAIDALHQTLAWLSDHPLEWDVINIGADRLKYTTPLTPIVTQSRTFSLVRGHYFPMTTTGLIWSREGAERFMSRHTSIFAPIDFFLREWQCVEDRGLALSPPLVVASGAMSDIDGGQVARKVGGRSSFYGWRKQKRVLRNKFKALRHKWLRRLNS